MRTTAGRTDLVVMDQDLFEIDPAQVQGTRAVLTILNGNVVYRRKDVDRY